MDLEKLFSVAGKNVVVTGGSRGIGEMIAEGFVRNGANVLITSRKADQLQETADRLAGLGSCAAHAADMATADGRESFAAFVDERAPELHVLINNAGATWGAPLGEYPESAWDRVLGVNLVGLFELTQRLLPNLRRAASPEDPARVVNIGSIDGIKVSQMDHFAYPASKAAVHMLTRTLSAKLAPDHITVNAIAPGPFPSKMTEWMLSEHGEMIAASTPLARLGQPEDAAGTAIFLSSRAGAYLTGTVIPVDGGISA